MKTGEVNCSTSLCSFLTLTAASPESAKAKLREIWPQYEAQVLEYQKVLWVPCEKHEIKFNEESTDAQRRHASAQLDRIRRELKKKCNWTDS